MRCRPTLRLFIGVLCATVCVVVAATTLTITYSVSLSTVRDIGRKNALALATLARAQTEDFFAVPTSHLRTMASPFNLDDWDMPNRDPLGNVTLIHQRYFIFTWALNAAVNFSYAALGFVFDDNSGMSSYLYHSSEVNTDVYFFYAQNSPAGKPIEWTLRLINMTEQPNHATLPPAVERQLYPFPAPDNDIRFAAYYDARRLVFKRNGMWWPVQLYNRGGVATPDFIMPGGMPIFNKSGQACGFAILAQPLTKISEFLLQAKSTEKTEAFAIDSAGYLVGSTHKTPYYNMTTVTTAPLILESGCATTASSNYDAKEAIFVGCRVSAAAFPYAPLQRVVSTDGFIGTGTNVALLDVNGDGYFAVAAPVANPFQFWGLTIALVMPESDVLGDLVVGRNTAIGVTVAVCVVAAVTSFLLVFLLLRPLTAVSRRMLDTAKLRDRGDDDKQFSNLAEIQDLQKAYSNMNTAIKSFTRYVPRDVVKDLMLSGQLCAINMVPQRCTMLFVDIAGFTTVCERVPPDVLSGLVSQYFDRASRIVMDHDGLIDKFIGDCIMAVWGAPFMTPNQEVKATLTGKLLDRETVVDPLARSWDEAGEQLRVRVGISTGEVLAGNMGSAERMNYTVIGDPVNLAARLESMNKQFGTRVMVSEMTAEGLGNVFVLRLLLPIAVVGKDQPVKVYEVVGMQRQIDHVDVERMQILDDSANADAKEASDSNSESQRSVASSMGRHRRARKQTNAMIRDVVLKTAQDTPVTASEDEVTFAQQYTKTVHQYLRKDFRGALSSIGALRKMTPGHLLSPELTNGPSTRSSYAEKSLAMLEKLCEEYATNCPEDFDGVYKALEK